METDDGAKTSEKALAAAGQLPLVPNSFIPFKNSPISLEAGRLKLEAFLHS
jgi:hypothetical protein